MSRVTKIFDPTLSFSPSAVPRQNTALLLLDYQGLTVSRLGEEGAKTVKVANDMRQWARNNDVPVFHCTVDIREKPSPTSRISERWSNYESMLKEKPQIGDMPIELSPKKDERVFPRRPGLVSALSSLGILEALKERQSGSLVLAGLSTSGCVLSTVRMATDLGFVVTVVEDACCDPVPGLHDMLVKHVFPMTAHVASSGEVQAMWDGAS